MTGPNDAGLDKELLPEGIPAFGDPTYDELRADLAAIAETGPMPADVVARLDDVLADLAGSRTDSPAADELTDHAVVPLRRRSRLGPRLLVAAAAVIVVGGGGVGLAQVVSNTQNEKSDQSTAAGADSGAVAPTAPEAAVGGSPADGTADTLNNFSGGRVLALTRADFGSQASTALAEARDFSPLTGLLAGLEERGSANSPMPDAVAPQSRDLDAPTTGATATRKNLSYRVAKALCTPKVAGAATAPITLDGTAAVLVVFPVVDGVRHVEARACDGVTVLATADLPQ